MKIFFAVLNTGFKGFIFTSFIATFVFFSPLVSYQFFPNLFLNQPAAMATLYTIYVGVGGLLLTLIACIRVMVKGFSLEKSSTQTEEILGQSSKEEYSGTKNANSPNQSL
jgi:hypothetical protein